MAETKYACPFPFKCGQRFLLKFGKIILLPTTMIMVVNHCICSRDSLIKTILTDNKNANKSF